jgi:hypothetical protein
MTRFEVLVVKPHTPTTDSSLLTHALVEHDQLQFVGANLVQVAISAALARVLSFTDSLPFLPDGRVGSVGVFLHLLLPLVDLDSSVHKVSSVDQGGGYNRRVRWRWG